MQEKSILATLTEAALAVPQPLAEVAALGICEDVREGDSDTACVDCQTAVRYILAYVYAYEPAAYGDRRPGRGVQCIACLHVRRDGGEATTCVFHTGADHWMTREWLPPIPERGRHRRSWWRRRWSELVLFLMAPIM